MKLDLTKNEITLSADQVLWITVNGFSVRIVGTDTGRLKLGVWPLGDENSDCLVSTELPACCGS